jgi:hypothetical protein
VSQPPPSPFHVFWRVQAGTAQAAQRARVVIIKHLQITGRRHLVSLAPQWHCLLLACGAAPLTYGTALLHEERRAFQQLALPVSPGQKIPVWQ